MSGIDYYEVSEGSTAWEKAASPYLLKDQTLGSIIKVRVVDKAGNERIFEIVPEEKEKPSYYLGAAIGASLVLIIWWIWKKLKKKKSETSNE